MVASSNHRVAVGLRLMRKVVYSLPPPSLNAKYIELSDACKYVYIGNPGSRVPFVPYGLHILNRDVVMKSALYKKSR